MIISMDWLGRLPEPEPQTKVKTSEGHGVPGLRYIVNNESARRTMQRMEDTRAAAAEWVQLNSSLPYMKAQAPGEAAAYALGRLVTHYPKALVHLAGEFDSARLTEATVAGYGNVDGTSYRVVATASFGDAACFAKLISMLNSLRLGPSADRCELPSRILAVFRSPGALLILDFN